MAFIPPTGDTTIHEIAPDTYRISTPVPPSVVPGGFTFNQYLVVDDAPLLFHAGQRRLFPQVAAAIARVMPVERLRYVALSHFEADECGALNQFLAAAPLAKPVCGKIAAMVSVDDFADRPPHVLADGETLTLGTHAVKWFDAPHLPHGWECGYIADPTTHTLFCGDLFACNGTAPTPLIETDILGPSEQFRAAMDPYAHAPNSRALLERLASSEPTTLALMHGSAWRGDGAALLRALAGRLTAKHPLAA